MDYFEKIKKLSGAFGVSGDEYGVAEIGAEYMRPFVDEVSVDRFGNAIGFRKAAEEGAKTVMIATHLDQIGFLVTKVTDEGFLRFTGIGVDPRMLPGSRLKIHTETGDRLGVVISVPPHIQKGDATKAAAITDMAVDTGMTGEEAKKIFRIGDYMYFEGETINLLPGVVSGKAMDDRLCFCAAVAALEKLKDEKLPVNLFLIGSTKEEVGSHGAMAAAYKIRPDLGIAVDVCHARTPDNVPGDNVVAFGGGPTIGIGPESLPVLARRAQEVARAKKIPYQIEALPTKSGTDACGIQPVDAGIPTLVISLPLKYMHSPVETVNMQDFEGLYELLAALIKACGSQGGLI